MKKRFTWSSFKVDARLNLHIFCVTDNLHILPVERFYNMRENSAELVPYNEMRSIVAGYCKELNDSAQRMDETTKTQNTNNQA